MAPESPYSAAGVGPDHPAHQGHATPPYHGAPFHGAPYHGATPPYHGAAPPYHGATPPYHGATPPHYGAAHVHPELARLKQDATTWLLVTLVGVGVGLGWIAAPLAWYKTGKLRTEYRALGMQPCGNTTAAWVISILVTALFSLLLLALAGILVTVLVLEF